MNKTRRIATAAFEQLGFGNSLDLAVKAEAVLFIRKKMEEADMTQTKLAKDIGWRQPRLSDLLRGKLDLFSYDAINEVLAPFKAVIQVNPTLHLPKPKREKKAA